MIEKSENKLTDNGIEKLVGGISGVIVQALNVVKKNKNNQNFYGLLFHYVDAN